MTLVSEKKMEWVMGRTKGHVGDQLTLVEETTLMGAWEKEQLDGRYKTFVGETTL